MIPLRFHHLCLRHQRRIDGRSNYGWFRAMVHGLGQQAMRMDLGYYRAYVALRPEGAHELISYPYYAKYARPGDSTAICHIDVNLDWLLSENRGGNQIQGSISLDDEAPPACTLITQHVRTLTPLPLVRPGQEAGQS